MKPVGEGANRTRVVEANLTKENGNGMEAVIVKQTMTILIIQPLPVFQNLFGLNAPLSIVLKKPSFVQSDGQHHGRNSDIEN